MCISIWKNDIFFILIYVYLCLIFSPVQFTRFTCDDVHIVSGGDDKVVRLYDVPSEKQLVSYHEHLVIVQV